MTRDAIWLDIVAERFRQKRLMIEGKFDRDMADPDLTPAEKLTVCSEEFGEVARIVCESLTTAVTRPQVLDTEHLREELVQLATCCVAWIEQLDDVPQEGLRLVPAPQIPYPHDPYTDGLPIEAFVVEAGAS